MESPKIGQVYRIPWRCDKLARVDGLPYGTLVALEWVDPAWARTERGLLMLIKDFLSDPKPILMED
jgi:hypothetical protein